ncbi:DUF4912 domain-containing protein [Candidatus Omnitrophota bacterium]
MFDISQEYGDNKIVLMVRDPWTIYTYWEVAGSVEDSVRGQIGNRGLEAQKSVLRIYEITSEGEKETFDFELRDWANSWYIHTPTSGKNWVAEIGIVAKTGEFFSLAKSNTVKTPSHTMSDICDEEWMCPEDLYYKLFTYEVGTSSFKIKKSIEEHLTKKLSSDGVSPVRSAKDGE